MSNYKPGDITYIVESAFVVREVMVHSSSGGFCTLRFTDTNGGIKVRERRLFPTREAAVASLPRARSYHPH